MSEEKKLQVGKTVYLNSKEDSGAPKAVSSESNPSFKRASDSPIKIVESSNNFQEPDNFQEEAAPTFIRASDRPVVIEESTPPVAKEEVVETPTWEDSTPFVEEEKVETAKPVKIQNSSASKAMDMLASINKSKEKSLFFEQEEVEEENAERSIGLDDMFKSEKEIEEIKAEPEKEKIKKKAKVVDLNKLTIVNKNEMDKERDLRQALFNNKVAFQIVAAQSGYMAKVSPLVHKDLVNILYGNLGRYEYKKSIYKVIFDKIFDFSVGKFNFEEWLKNTSVEDMETFYYGVYSSTFPNEGTFRYTCSKCDHEHDYKVNHANLIKTTDRDHMKKLIDEVSRNSTSVEKMREYSLIGKNQAVQLSESGLIIELRTPSLFDSLEILRTVPEKTIEKDAISVTNMLYINKVLIPSKDGTGYAEEYNKQAILRVIDNLPIEDASELQSSVYDRVDENRITYSIKNIKCSECSHEEKDIPISIEDILFTLIFEKAQ
jgi:hypothetical protein